MRKAFRHLLLSAVLIAPAGLARADDQDGLAPYKMLRSLQHVQDAIVLGDHSASDMQRFMLSAIDKRLREADPAVFDDPRNVDAALIYAMSGGNPQTLSALAARDIEGNFDGRVTDALGHYLAGKGGLMVERLSKAVGEYKNATIGPYLYLVLGNATALQDPQASLAYYDWARLTSPGTNIEEAALRRSLAIATREGLAEKSFRYALSYTRRFSLSPYAGQFADAFVELVVAHYSAETDRRMEETLSFLDPPRQREVYLRIARRAAIAGLQSLTKTASQRAEALSNGTDAEPKALAEFYSGLVNVPSTGIVDAVKAISAIPDGDLSPRDLSLRRAAEVVAQEVLRAPDPDSLTKAIVANVKTEDGGTPHSDTVEADKPAIAQNETGSGDSPFAASPSATRPEPSEAEDLMAAQNDSQRDPAVTAFLTEGRSKLDQIDALLEGKKNDDGD